MSQRSLLAFGIHVSQKRKADSESEKTVSSDQPAQKKCKTNSGSGSASNSRVFQPQWLKQFDWLEYDAETKRMFCRTCRASNIQNAFTKEGAGISLFSFLFFFFF